MNISHQIEGEAIPNGIRILDCTLRDGGYVNNWEFTPDNAYGILDGLYKAGIRDLEIGIMGKNSVAGRQTKFSSFAEMRPYLSKRKADCKYYVMLNQAGHDAFSIPMRDAGTVDCIRLAFFKSDWRDAVSNAAALMGKGYEVFLQAMATFFYSQAELLELIQAVNCLMPTAFYLVDSFGTIYGDEVARVSAWVDERLDPSIALGFHGHNNIQMAFANTITFLSCNTSRLLLADASIFGMGRGAGNVATELLMKYLNDRMYGRYVHKTVLLTYETYLKDIFEKTFWGYDPRYFLTAEKGMNSAYGWYLGTKGIKSTEEICGVLRHIPKDMRISLSTRAADEAIDAYFREEQEKCVNK